MGKKVEKTVNKYQLTSRYILRRKEAKPVQKHSTTDRAVNCNIVLVVMVFVGVTLDSLSVFRRMYVLHDKCDFGEAPALLAQWVPLSSALARHPFSRDRR